jgi:branched-subunit amino acid ABC-type transport system permease component
LSLCSFSFYLLFELLKFFHLPHGFSVAVAPYIIVLIGSFGFSLLGSILTSILIVIAIALLINHLVYNPLKRRKTENWQMLLASLGVYIVLQNIISLIWGDSTLSFRTWPVKQGHEFLGAHITDVQIMTIIACTVLLTTTWWFLEKTRPGQRIKAVSSNAELANVFGIPKNKVVLWSLAVGSGLAACSGILIAADVDMTPTMGFNWLLYGVVAMIIGGMGKMRYLLLGALLLATAQHLAAYYLDSKWMNATAYIILVVFLYFRPYGFSGKALRKAEI